MPGSQVFKLMRGVQESLTGRVALLHMSPLSQREISGVETVPFILDLEALKAQQPLVAPSSTPQIYERIRKGGMPALISGQYSDRGIYYSGYLETYQCFRRD